MITDAASVLNRYIRIKHYYINNFIKQNEFNLSRKNVSHDKLKTVLASNQLYPYVHNIVSDRVVEFYIAGALCKLGIDAIHEKSPVTFSDSYINKVIKKEPSEDPDYYRVVGQYLGRTSDYVSRVHYVCKDIDMPFGKKHVFSDRHTDIQFVEDDEQLLQLIKRADRAWKL